MADRNSSWTELEISPSIPTSPLTFDDIPRTSVMSSDSTVIDLSEYINQGFPRTTDFSVSVLTYPNLTIPTTTGIQGVTHKDGLIYFATAVDDRMVAVNREGEEVVSESFNLHADNTRPYGCHFDHEEREFMIVDRNNDSVFFYDENGVYVRHWAILISGFYPTGVVTYDNLVWVVNQTDDEVYAFSRAGTENSSRRFAGVETNLQGLTFGNGRFWLLNDGPSRQEIIPHFPDGTEDTSLSRIVFTGYNSGRGCMILDNQYCMLDNTSVIAFVEITSIEVSIDDMTQQVTVDSGAVLGGIDVDVHVTAHQPDVGDQNGILPIRIG